jgi:lipoprotein-releasing system permease protein
LNIEKFIANKISQSGQNKGNISKPIVKIGIIGITIGVSVMLLTVSIVLGFKKEIINKITGLTTHIAISSINVNSSNEPEPVKIGEDTLRRLKNLSVINHIQRTAFKNGILKTNTENEGVILKGVGNDYDFSFLKAHLVEGRLPQFNSAETSKDVFVSKTLVDKLNLKLNDKMLVYFISQHVVYDSLLGAEITKYDQRSRKLTICGIFKTNFADFDEKLSLVDIRQIQHLNYWDSTQVGSYEIKLNHFENLEKDIEQVRDLCGYHYNVLSVKELYSNIFIWLDKLDVNGVIVVVLMILVATINMITALLILILERTNMVGLLKALGMSNVSVRKIFLWVSLKLIGRGLLWGNIIGISLCLIQSYFKIAKLDSETYYVDFVAIEINWLYFLYLNIGTFLVCAAMLFLPTLIVTKLTPIKTLKFD